MTAWLLSTVAMALGASAPGLRTLTAREVRGSAGVVPLANEPPAKIVIDAPLPDPLARGLVVIQYRTENFEFCRSTVRAPSTSPRVSDISM